MIDEKELIRRAQRGEERAFESLVNAHALQVYNLALRVVRNPEEAQDIAQEAFVRAWRGLAQFQGTASFGTWLYRIVVNLCYNHNPKLKRNLELLLPEEAASELPDSRLSPEPELLHAELAAYLQRAIDQLPESFRLLITLRHLQEMSYDEIAAVTGMPLGTVKTGIFRARTQLRQMLEEYEKN